MAVDLTIRCAVIDWAAKGKGLRDRGDIQSVSAWSEKVDKGRHSKTQSAGFILVTDAPYASVEAASTALMVAQFAENPQDGDYNPAYPEKTLQVVKARRFRVDTTLFTSGEKTSLNSERRLSLPWSKFMLSVVDKTTGRAATAKDLRVV